MTQPEPHPNPRVQGHCPACRATSLFLGNGGYVTCSRLDCPDPTAADDLLHDKPTSTQPEPAQPRHTADTELWHLRLAAEGHDAALQAACRKTEEQRQRAAAAEVKLAEVRALAAYFIEHGNKRTGNERAAGRRFLDLLDRHQPQEKP